MLSTFVNTQWRCQRFTGMLTYLAIELRLLPRVAVRRPVRRAIFSHHLWNPHRLRDNHVIVSNWLPLHCMSPVSLHLRDCIWSSSIRTSLPSSSVSARTHPIYSVPKVMPIIFTLSSLFVLNAAALSKPHSVEYLAADLASYNIDVAVITETQTRSNTQIASLVWWLSHISAGPITATRWRHRLIHTVHNTSVWNCSADNHKYEIHWVRGRQQCVRGGTLPCAKANLLAISVIGVR